MRILGAMLFASFILTSCGGSSSKEPASTTEEPTAATEEKSTESSGDCDQFIKDYEEFVNSYIVVMKKMKANPSDMSVISEYTEMASKAANMQTDASDCNDAKYAAKLSQLATKMATAASKM